MTVGVASREAAVDDSSLWQFQRGDTQRRQQQQRDQTSWLEESDADPRIRSNGDASTSQPIRGWADKDRERSSPSQHPSWAAQDEKSLGRQKRVPQTSKRQSIDAGPVRTAPRRQGQPPPEEDDIWNYPSTNGREPDRKMPVSSRSGRSAQGGGRDARGSRQPGSNAFPSSRSATQEPDDPWNAPSSRAEPQAIGWDEVSPQQRRSQPRQQRDNRQNGRAANSWNSRSREQPEQPDKREIGQARRRDPWKQMVNQKDPMEMDRKARVRIAIACNRIVLTAFEQFCIEEKAAERMADRQEVLQEFIYKVEDTMLGNESCMDAVNVSVAFQKLAAACCAVSPVGEIQISARRIFQKLVSMALNLQGSFKLDPLNMTLGALARLSAQPSSNLMPPPGTDEALDIQVLLEGFAVRAWNRISEPPAPEPTQLSLLVWAYSRLSLDPLGGKLFRLVEQKAEPLISRFDSQNVSNFLLAAATLEKPISEEVLNKLARQAILKMPQATPQGIANLLWAFGKLTKVSPAGGDLFRSALSRASEVIADFSPQNVANLLWAAVQFEQPMGARTLTRLAAAALKKIQGTSPVTIAGLLSSYSKLADVNGRETLFLACIEEVDKKLEQCNSHTLSNLIWTLGFAKVSLPSEMLHRLDSAWAERCLIVLDEVWGRDNGWSQNVSNILWGYSQLRLDPLQGRFFQSILSRLEGSHLSVMHPMNTSSILMAAASMQRMSFSPDFLKRALSQIIADAGVQEIANTMWSLATLGLLRPPIMHSLTQQLIKVADGKTLHEFPARQLLMANLVLASQGKAGGTTEVVPEWLLDQCRATIQDHKQPIIVSGFHEEVSAALESMGVPHAIEFSSPDGLLSIDIVARCGDGNPLAIEVDGEEHFTRLPPLRPLGHTVIRNQMIAALGFRGVGIPWYDWRGLALPQDKESYLTARIAKWGIAPS